MNLSCFKHEFYELVWIELIEYKFIDVIFYFFYIFFLTLLLFWGFLSFQWDENGNLDYGQCNELNNSKENVTEREREGKGETFFIIFLNANASG